VTFGGLPSLRITSTTTTPLSVTITLPSGMTTGASGKRRPSVMICMSAM
jgi:hypothetical protein